MHLHGEDDVGYKAV